MLLSIMSLPDDLRKCLVLNTIATARALLRRYDSRLRPHGITVQQFALMTTIRFNPDVPMAELAKRVFLDRTSLKRNLDLLERKRLARRVSGAVKNAHLCKLTQQGDELLDRLLPEWQNARSELMDGLTKQDAETYLFVAEQISQE